jgi:hypothetical protein
MAEKDLGVGLTVGGQTLEKVVRKIRFDIEELKSAVAQQKGVEFSDEFIDGIVTRVKDALAVKRIYAQEKEFQETARATQTQMFMLRSEMEDRVKVVCARFKWFMKAFFTFSNSNMWHTILGRSGDTVSCRNRSCLLTLFVSLTISLPISPYFYSFLRYTAGARSARRVYRTNTADALGL